MPTGKGRVKRGVRESENKKLIQLSSPFSSKPEMYHSSYWLLSFFPKGGIIKIIKEDWSGGELRADGSGMDGTGNVMNGIGVGL